MDISGKLNGEIVKYSNKSNKKHDGTTAQVDVAFILNQAGVETHFGPDVAQAAFGSMQVSEGEDGNVGYRHLQDAIKLARKSNVFQKHQVTLSGEDESFDIQAQPSVIDISTIQGLEQVEITVRIPIDSGTDASSWCDAMVGNTIGTRWAPMQQQMFPRAVDEDGSEAAPTEAVA